MDRVTDRHPRPPLPEPAAGRTPSSQPDLPPGPPPGRRLRWCAGWLGCAGWAALFPLISPLGPHRVWGALAAAGYLAAAVVALLPLPLPLPPSPGGRDRARRAVALSGWTAFGGAVLLPLALLVGSGSGQSEVSVLARAGELLLAHGSPYLDAPAGPAEVTPYLPGLAAFGLPHALLGRAAGPATDPRLWCATAFLATGRAAWRHLAPTGARSRDRDHDRGGRQLRSWRWESVTTASTPPQRTGVPSPARTPTRSARVGVLELPSPTQALGTGRTEPAAARTGLVALLASPPVALGVAASGVDLPLTGLLCLALALGAARRPAGAGAALAVAGALKWTAWPAVPVVVALLAVTAGRRAALRCAGVAVAGTALLVAPWLVRAPGPLLRQVFAFPLGRGPWPTPAASPLPGRLLADLGPAGWGAAVGLLLLGGAAVALSLLLRPPRHAVAAADRLAAGLALAFLLAPAGRFGYLALPLFLSAFTRLATAPRSR